MVIQRIQSVFLLIAALLMILVCFVAPVAYIPVEGAEPAAVYITSLLPLLILNLIVALLLLIDIFLFKALKFQMKVVQVCIVLIVFSAIIEAFVVYSQAGGAEAALLWSGIMLLVSLLFAALALQGMKSDYKKLHSYDRLR